MGVSMGSRQGHPVTSSKSNETFRICRAFYADYFDGKIFKI